MLIGTRRQGRKRCLGCRHDRSDRRPTLCEQGLASCIHACRKPRSRRSSSLSALASRRRLIHEYQTDASSKPPAPRHLEKEHVSKTEKNRLTRVVPYQGTRSRMSTGGSSPISRRTCRALTTSSSARTAITTWAWRWIARAMSQGRRDTAQMAVLGESSALRPPACHGVEPATGIGVHSISPAGGSKTQNSRPKGPDTPGLCSILTLCH